MSAASATAVFPSLDGSPQLLRAPFQSHLVKPRRFSHHDHPNVPVRLNLLPPLALYSRPLRAARAAAAPTPVVAATAAAPRGGIDGEYDRNDQWDGPRRSEDYEDDYNEDFFASDVALPPGARFGKRDQPDESWINDSDWSRGSAGPRKAGQVGEGEGYRGRRQQGDRGGVQGSRGGRSGRDGESAGAGRGRMRGSAGGGDGWGELEEAEGAAERRRVLEEQGIAQQRRGLGFKGGRGGYGGGETGRFGAGEARERGGAGREETRLAQGSGFRREREGLPEGRREERSEMGVRREAREEGWKAAGEQRGYGREGRGGGWVGDRRVGGNEEDGEEGETRSRGSGGGSRGSRGVSRRQWGEYGEEEDRGERGTRSFGVAAAAAAGATAAATAAAGASLLPLTAAAPSSPALPSAPSPSRSPSPPLSTFPSPSPSLSPSLSASPSTSPSASPTSARAPKLKLARPRGVPSPGKPGEGVRPGVLVCYGCGAELQTRVEDAPGYIPPDRYEMKKRHKQLRSLVCTRCQQLSHGRMVAAVTGHGGYRVTGPADMFVTAEALRQQLTYVRGEKALVVKLVDLVDFSGSFLSRIRDIVDLVPEGTHMDPVSDWVLAASSRPAPFPEHTGILHPPCTPCTPLPLLMQVDLVPEGTHMDPVADWVLAAVAKKKLNVLAVHFVSAKARTGLSSVAATIQRERQGRDVYVLGAANVGKSAFICALLDEMASRDIMAAAARRRRPVASAMPGTTLGPICLKAFSGGGDLYDTPGVHLHHRMAAMLHPWDLHHLGPKRRLRSFVVTGPLEQHTGAGKGREKTEEKAEKAERGEKGEKGEQKESVEEAGGEARAEEGTSGEQNGLQGTSLFWGGLVRIDVVKAPAGTALTFFGPVAIRVSTVPTPAANAFYEAEVGRLLVPPSKPLEEPAWEGLPSQRAFSFRLPAKRSSPVADIAISGLGWVSLSGVKPRQRTNPDADVSSSDATTSSHAGHVEPTGSWDDPDAANDARGGITRFEDPGNQTLGMGYNDEDGHGSSGLFGKQESDVEVVVHVPKGIEVFVRPPMPVGWFANDWYQYEELSEKGEMSRPRVFHDEAKMSA
ncbi:unnamed protein product [Closterium sp. Naga37s-1]|nr:unnamed protein product [Closterium sp. Naga37s-1]